MKYLFQAIFKDGSTYSQNETDTPQVAPQGSAFTDIKDRLDDIKEFLLYREGDLVCKVNLIDGHFEVNGQSFSIHDSTIEYPPDTKYRLIYFRRVWQNRHSDGTNSTNVAFFIGWQVNIDGKNHQRIISVA